jgi:hypothetical protein
MRPRLRTLAVCAALGAAGAARVARADDDPPASEPSKVSPAEQDKVTAADLRVRADKAFNEGDFRAALAHNLAAYRLLRDRATACNAGLLARKMAADSTPDAQGEYHELAAELLERCTAQYKLVPASTDEELKNAARYFRALELSRGELGAVRVIAPDPGVEVRIAGRMLGHGPLDVTAYVRDGLHEVTATRGNKTERSLVQVQKRGAYSVRIEIPVATAQEDKEEPAPPPLIPRRVAAPPAPLLRDPLFIVGTATSGGAAVAAAVLFGLSGVRNAEADEARQEAQASTGTECFRSFQAPEACRTYRQESGNAQNLAVAGFVSLGGGVLSGAATLVYVLTNSKKGEQKPITIKPKGVGMVVQWR